MSITVQGPDGAEIEFPEGTPPDVMKAAMQKRYGGPKRTLGGDFANAALKLGRDLGGSIPFIDKPGQYQPHPLALPADVGGMIAPPVQAMMRPVARDLESVGIHAGKAEGGPLDFHYRQMTTNEHADELANDAMTSASLLAPARPRGVPLINTPQIQPRPAPQPRPPSLRTRRIRALQAAGIDLTPGQLVGGLGKNWEDSVATSSGAVRQAHVHANEGLNNAVMNDAVSPIGGQVDGAGRQAVESMHEQISDALNSAFNGARFAPDAGLQTDVQAAAQNLLPSSRGEAVQITREFVRDAQHPDGLSEAFARLTRMRTQASSQGNASLANFIHDLQQSALDAMERSGTDVQAVREARDAFRRSVVPERAASMIGAQDGVFSPEQLFNAVKASDRTVRKNAFAQGNAQYQDIAEAAKDVMGRTIGSSGTAERATLSDPVKFAIVTARNLALRSVYNRPVIRLLNQISQAQTPQAVTNGLASLRQLSATDSGAAEALRLLAGSGGASGPPIQAGLGAMAAPAQPPKKRPTKK